MKIKKSCLTILLYIAIALNGFGQNKIILSGNVVDSEDNSPIPFCNVYIEYTSIGTITNNDGAFILAVNQKEYRNLCFSFVGYKTKKITIAKLSGVNNTIKLSKDEIPIDEVVIMPDSTLLGFLRKAYRAIEQNYPQYPTKTEGFYRETLLDNQNEYLYFSEAILNVFKNSYKYKNDPGQIEIIKSRKKVFPLSDEINKNIRFSGGAFMSLTQDIVLHRTEFINPKHFDEYSYNLSNITRIDGRTVYEISFDTKNDTLKGSYEGKFYLDKESLAYVMAQFKYTHREIKKFNSLNFIPFKLLEANGLATYYYLNNKWYLKYCRVEGKVFNIKYNSNLQLRNEFLTTNIEIDSVKPIPYEKQMAYHDIFLDKATPYEETNWKDYNIIKTNNDLLFSIEQAKDVYEKKIEYKNKDKVFNFLKHLNYNYGLIVLQNNIPEGIYEVSFDNSTISQKIDDENFLIGLELSIGYKLNNNYNIRYTMSKSFDKIIYFKSDGFGIEYLKNIKPKGKPLFLKLDLYGYKNSYGINFSHSLSNIEYNNEQIAKSKLTTQILRESWGIRPNVSLSYQITRLLEVYLSCSYSFNLTENYLLKFKEESGLFKKTYKESIINGTVNYNGNQLILNTIDMNPIVLSFGFNIGFN